jgi:CubicO group peptidase (beta-lactamase class C family)
MRVFLIAAALLVAACQSSQDNNDSAAADCPALAGPDSALAADINPIVDAAVSDGFGGQVAIMRDGVIAYDRAAGFADTAQTVRVRTDTLYQVSSMAKYFTAVMVLKAVEEGRLSLSASAADLFPGTALAGRDFTLADLLAHRSGLRSTYAAERETEAGAAIAAIAAANKENPKDGEFHYSNDGYDLLAILLERIYGKSYEAIFRENLAAPACLKNFGFWAEAAINDPNVRGQPLEEAAADLHNRNYGMIGSAGLLITARDLILFQRALAGGRILSDASLRALYAPRGKISIGDALFGSFLIDSPSLGAAISVRGSEDWGDNSYLNDYRRCDIQIAIVTSRGPAEDSGKPLFRDQLIGPIEEKLASRCVTAK